MLMPLEWAFPKIIFILFLCLTAKVHARSVELYCQSQAQHSLKSPPSNILQTARVQFDDSRTRTGAPSAIKIEWQQPGRNSQFGGIAAERKVRWSGLLIRSIEFSISPKFSFELLFSPSDDIYVVRRKKNGQPETELPCRIDLQE
jgi:hypothetical protein